MITLTLEKTIKLSKNSFVDIEELFDEYKKNQFDDGNFIELGEILKDELSEESKKKIEWAKTLPNSAFTNI